MADRILSSGATVAQSLGIRPPMRQTITTGLADLEVEKQAALDRIAGLGAASAPRLRPPPDSALRAGPDIYYSPSTDRYAAGGMEFGATEYDVALRAMENLQAPTAPPGGDFQRIAPSTLEAYRQSISEGRGFMGNLAVGAQNVGEGIVGGIGRGLQMLGAEGAGQALVNVGEAIGVSPAEQARSAAIAQEQGIVGQIGTATVQSAPTLGVSLAAGLAGAAVGGPVGALAGVALSILPMELQSSWEAAEQGGLDTSDPEIQTEILASTLFKTGVQTFGTAYLARGLSPAFRTMLGDVSKRTMGARITRGIGAGALEGSAEAIAQATDRVAFDPELRASMTEGDWAAIAPAFVNKYGTEALVAFGAGFLLGAPLGAIASPEAAPQTPPSPRRNVDSGQQIDALSGATLEPQAQPGLFGELPVQPTPIREFAGPQPQPAAPVGTQLELPLGPEQPGLFAPMAEPVPTREFAGPQPQPVAPVGTQLPLDLPPVGEPTLFTPAEMGVGRAAAARLQPEQALRPGTRGLLRGAEPPAQPVQPVPDTQLGLPLQPPPATARPLEGPMNALRQRQEALAAERARREAEFAAAEQQRMQQDVDRLRQQQLRRKALEPGSPAVTEWDVLVEEKGHDVTLDMLPPDAQQTWADAVLKGTADEELYNQLRETVRVPEAPPALPEGVIGTTKKRPFKERPSELSIRNASKRSGVPVSRLEPVEVPGGWGLRVLPETPTPPTGGKTTRTPPSGGGAGPKGGEPSAVQKPSAAPRTLRKGPEDGQAVGEGDAQGQEAAGARVEEAQAQPQKVGGLSQAEREAAQQANKAADLLIGRDREAPARRTQEQIAAEQARVEAARAEAATRTETVAAAERAAIQEPQLPAPAPATELSAAAQAWADAQAENPDIEIDYDELPEKERLRWDGNVRRGEATPRKARESVKRVLGKGEADAELTLEAIADAERYVLGAREDPNLSSEALDAGVDLFVLRNDPTTPKDQVALIDRIFEQNLTRTQYAEAERIYQQRNQIARLNGEEGPVSPETRAAQAGVELLDMVTAYNRGDDWTRTRAFGERFAALVRDIRKVPRENTTKLQAVDYAKTDGMPNIVKGKIRPIRGFETDGATSLRGYNTLEGAADMSGKPVGPMPTGKLRMAAQAFLSRLAEKPNTFYFKDQADLRARNPELYARAEAARPQGDFAEVDAAAYFFGGDNVIVFTDRIANTGHLNTVMAHEIMGHYGIRAIVGNANFRKVMDAVYKNSTDQARVLIDQAAEARGLSRAEATEEYLSDYAARIETNILQRWWNAVKGALNKLGVRFGDEHARYLLAQARRYTTLGQQASAFDAEVMGLRLNTLESGVEPSGDGRFARANESVAASAINAARLVETAGIPRPKNLDDALARVQDFAKRNVGMNVADFYDTLKSQTFTPTLWRSIRNQGFNRVWLLIRERYDIARTHINRMQEKRSAVLRPAVEVAGRTLSGGLTMASRTNIGKALKANRIRASYRYARRRSPPSLFRFENGQYVFQSDVYKKLKSRRTTRKEFKEGFDVKFDIAVPLTPEIRAQIEAERDVELAAAKTDAERKRIERAYNKRLRDTSYTDTYTEEFQYDFTDAEWDAYVAELDSMAETSVELLRSQLERFSEEQDTTYTRIQRAMNAPLTEGDRKLIDRLVEKFTDITVGSAKYDDRGVRKQSSLNTRRAEAFILAVNKALLAPEGEVRPLENLFSPDAEGAGGTPFFDAGERAEVEAAIQDFRTRYKPEKPKAGEKENPARFVVQQEVRSLANERIVIKDAEAKAAHDIETSYVPFFREGGWQVRMAFIGADGREYAMTDRYRDQTAYFQFDSRAEAEGAVPGLTELFDPDGETTYEMEVFDPNANNGLGGNVIMKGKLVPQTSAVITTATTDPELNFNESMRFLRRFNLHPDPARAEQIILALTSQNDRAIMRQLRAAFVAGSENDLTQAISQHIESRASTIARNRTNVRLANALDLSNGESRKLWYGDRDEYNRRKAAWEAAQADPNMGPDAKHMARVAFDEYHSWFKTHDSAKRGGSYYNEARKLVTFLDQQKQVLETDMASNPVVERLRTTTAVSFLMSSIASGALNIVGLFTNVPAALATYNARNAYGGGFGWDGFVEVFRALTTVGMSLKPGGDFDTAKYWSDLSDAELKKKGMTREEADFLADGIAGGFLDAAQFNSLTGSARGRVTSGAAQKFVEWAMLPFNTTEQTSRRAAALAAFRLEFNRRVNAGANRVDAAKTASRFAESLVASTLGDYTTANRPAFFRGGIQQFAFMFKQFVVNSATLLANLDRKGKIVMLGSLLLLAGLRGIPFAEDIEDIVDSLAAKFGIPVPSIREYMIAKGNDVMPGFGNLLMSGAFNQFIGTDFGARTGLGNIVPGTEMFLPGAEMSRVLEEIGGPMVSFTQSALTTMGNVLDFAPGGRPGDLETLIREQPISILRAWGDAYAYQRSGAVVDRRGYLVSDEYNAGVSLMRVLGFYPLSASREYDIVRIGKRRTEYLRSYTTAFRDAIVRAEARGDRAEANRLYEQVREWNRYAQGTGLEIEGIRQKVQRALKAQRQLASERFIQSTARSVRPYIEAYEGMYAN